MDDEVRASHRLLDVVQIADVPLDHLDASLQRNQTLAFPGREIVQHSHLIAPLEQAPYDVRPDEPRPTGDQVDHGFESVPFVGRRG